MTKLPCTTTRVAFGDRFVSYAGTDPTEFQLLKA
jgi:hypothetical protein